MEGLTLSLVIVVLLAVVFDYINGFHDTANAIATSVATRALRPSHAILMATAFNFIGAFAGTAVAKTIGSGLVDEATTTPGIVAAALLGAIAWNLFTWWLGLPSSSSHCAHRRAARCDGHRRWVLRVQVGRHLQQGHLPDGDLADPRLHHRLRLRHRHVLDLPAGPPKDCRPRFRRIQVGSAAYMAFAHGSNDAQKTMGIITLALFAAGVISDIDRPAVGHHHLGDGV